MSRLLQASRDHLALIRSESPARAAAFGWTALLILCMVGVIGLPTEAVAGVCETGNPYVCCAILGPNHGDTAECCTTDYCGPGQYCRYEVERVGSQCNYYGDASCSCF